MDFSASNLRQAAREMLQRNLHHSGGLFICPSYLHYPYQWLWDSCFHAVICCELDLAELAKNEIEKLLIHQREDGFIPHMIFWGRRVVEPLRNPDTVIWELFERGSFPARTRLQHSSFTQPAVMGRALRSIPDREFARRVFPNVLRFHLYFTKRQDPDGDGLISNCHPCENGRDNTPEFDFFKTRIRGISRLNNFLETYSISKLSRAYGKVGWDIERIWRLGIVDVEDVMFNCIWIDGMYALAELCEDRALAAGIEERARRSEDALYRLCWDEKDGIFYSLRPGHEKIRSRTVSNLFPLILPHLPGHMRDGLISHLTNPVEYWTPFPVPSVAADDPDFNPDIKVENMCWRGPVWMNMNWYLIRGLVRHGRKDLAETIARKSVSLVEKHGFREFFNPFTGEGMRVDDLAWTGLVVTFEKLLSAEEQPPK